MVGERERRRLSFFLVSYLSLYKCMYMATSFLGPRWLLLQLPEGEAGREDEDGEEGGGEVVVPAEEGLQLEGGGGREGGRGKGGRGRGGLDAVPYSRRPPFLGRQ